MNALAMAFACVALLLVGLLALIVGHARRRIAALTRTIVQHEIATLGLRNDNRHLAEWCARFRDLYLATVTLVDPQVGAQLRRRWASVQAPEIVTRALEHCRHG